MRDKGALRRRPPQAPSAPASKLPPPVCWRLLLLLSSSACHGLSKDLGSNAVACLQSSLHDLLGCSKMSSIKTSFFPTWRLFFESRTSPDAQLGLWTLSPHSSAVPAPAIPFSHWSAVFPQTSRDLRLSSHFRFR